MGLLHDPASWLSANHALLQLIVVQPADTVLLSGPAVSHCMHEGACDVSTGAL